jgi:hypothetical protein
MHGLPASATAIHTIRAPGDEHVAAARAAPVMPLTTCFMTLAEQDRSLARCGAVQRLRFGGDEGCPADLATAQIASNLGMLMADNPGVARISCQCCLCAVIIHKRDHAYSPFRSIAG